MGKAVRSSALILLLACSAQAGWMGNGVTQPPPPPPETETTEQVPTSTVQEPTADGHTQSSATDSLTKTVLDLLAGVLTLV
jgi:hypothetical protein